MDKRIVEPLKIFNQIELILPSSKSLTQRALICASLARGKSLILNPLQSEDPLLLKEALEKTGVLIEKKEGHFEVKGIGGRPELRGNRVYLGNNGTGARFFLALSALGEGEWVELYGKERLHERPMFPLINALRKLSAKIECLEKEGHLPVRIYPSTLKSSPITLPGNVSSQFISALLLIGPYLPEGLYLRIEGELFSKSYIDMTIEVMDKFGVEVECKEDEYRVKRQNYKPTEYEVPADASSSSYFLALPLVLGRGKVIIKNYDYLTKQGDVVFLDFLKEMGAEIRRLEPLGVEVSFEGRPKGGRFNLRDYPDLFPTMAILGALSNGETILYGAPHLRYKETDRIKAMATELTKVGVSVEELPDGLKILGSDSFKTAEINTYDDHRIAMAFAILALRIGPLVLENPSCVEKSFPTFWELLDRLYVV
ncbi:MAG: 3-phosphoshikimate 1-carboxyvinyltransferase [Caldimicrobium sp.]|nr:3-phosphoshikimate 1-carboxyvinyltransferase [Caldimicrobium sp.]MCX7873621.1 3-phosphoshikimate 1-carboxyvinyltransferase [Caldimicrobium sp.]MDW8094425.1 3-phosphoshikimate 1-carboxyvinyltransferase [Caldimicrobium sp.]